TRSKRDWSSDVCSSDLIDQQDGDFWLISFANLTSGQTLQRTLQYTSTVSSAEWIEEAPFARRRVLPISQFGSLTFTSASAVKDRSEERRVGKGSESRSA